MDEKIKSCTKCSKEKPITEFGVRKSRAKNGGPGTPFSSCKICLRLAVASWKQKQPIYIAAKKKKAEKLAWGEDNPGLRLCNKCYVGKLPEDFAKNITKKDGLDGWCLKCCANNQALRYKENPEHLKKIQRKSQKKNWASVCARNKKWIKANPEKWRKMQRKSYLKYKEARKEQSKNYRDSIPIELKRARMREAWRRQYKKNPERIIAFNRHRDAKKLGATPSWVDKEAIIKIYAEASKIQKESGTRHDVDHIVPLNHKLICGLHVPWNLQILTKSDNCKKSNIFKIGSNDQGRAA